MPWILFSFWWQLGKKGDFIVKIKPFAVEEWMNEWEAEARYNIAETCVDSISLDELFEITGEDKNKFLDPTPLISSTPDYPVWHASLK